MATLSFNNVGMTAIAACVPSKVIHNTELTDIMDETSISNLIKGTGIERRHIADKDVCTSDLCYKAAKKLMEDNNISPESIDILIFSTLTPDYINPPTAPILQHRLGLPATTACFDLSFACAGFIYALSTAYSMVSNENINRALVLVGETSSKFTNTKDKVNWPLYGDAGTACLVEKGDFGVSHFSLTSDGSGAESVMVPYGGFRNPVTADSLIDKEREDGNFRRDIDIYMDGMETFNHAIRVIPKQIKNLFSELKINGDDVDYLVSHQANKLMIEFILKKLKVDVSKAPFCLEEYGNTGSASIPLTICSRMSDKLNGQKRLLFSAIGAGWSFGTAYLNTKDLRVSPVFDY